MDFPIKRIAEPRTIRLVPSARLRDPVLKKLAKDQETFDALIEIEGATSGRLSAQERGTNGINAREFIYGVPHAHFINAAFSYWRPKELNRFNKPDRGAWYAALNAETCISEVAFHMMRELERVNDFNAVVDYAEMFASFAGDFVDLRNIDPKPDCLNPDIDIGYPKGNALSQEAREKGCNGIIYPSVKHVGGTCIVALRPQAVQSVAQGNVIRITWAGNSRYEAKIVTK